MPRGAQSAQEEQAQLAARGLGIEDFDQPHLGRAGKVRAAAGHHLKPADVTHADVVFHRWVLAQGKIRQRVLFGEIAADYAVLRNLLVGQGFNLAQGLLIQPGLLIRQADVNGAHLLPNAAMVKPPVSRYTQLAMMCSPCAAACGQSGAASRSTRHHLACFRQAGSSASAIYAR